MLEKRCDVAVAVVLLCCLHNHNFTISRLYLIKVTRRITRSISISISIFIYQRDLIWAHSAVIITSSHTPTRRFHLFQIYRDI